MQAHTLAFTWEERSMLVLMTFQPNFQVTEAQKVPLKSPKQHLPNPRWPIIIRLHSRPDGRDERVAEVGAPSHISGKTEEKKKRDFMQRDGVRNKIEKGFAVPQGLASHIMLGPIHLQIEHQELPQLYRHSRLG